MKRVIVLGAGGFIGGHLVYKLKELGYWVRGVDIKYNEFRESIADEFVRTDLREYNNVERVIDDNIDEVYQLAADMGGAEYIFSGSNDSDILTNSLIINLNVCRICVKKNVRKVFYSSSACIYPEHNQLNPDKPNCSEDSAYPANPDSEYGWEKILSERLYLSYNRNKNLDIRIARFHNIFGPYGIWCGGKEKAPAAICRKVSSINEGESIQIFGDGKQTRSFLYIDECIEGIILLMRSDYKYPINIGSDEMVTINKLVDIVSNISNKKINKKYIDGPLGVRGRNSDNNLISKVLNWKPTIPLRDGLLKTYKWINNENNKKIVFIHIPKNAGTTIKFIIDSIKNKRLSYFNKLENILDIDEIKDSYNKSQPSEFKIVKKNYNYYSFTVIRNPYNRIVSAFKWLIKVYEEDNKSIVPNKRRFVNLKYKKFFLDRNISFHNFVLMIEEILKNTVNEYNNIKWHIQPQYEQIIYNKQKIDYIIRYENFEQDLEKFFTNNNIIFNKDLLKINLNSSSNSDLSYRKYYNENTKRIIERIYNKDINYFGYKF